MGICGEFAVLVTSKEIHKVTIATLSEAKGLGLRRESEILRRFAPQNDIVVSSFGC
jgi:hypothetical protein